MAEPARTDQNTWARWHAEIEHAQKDDLYKTWLTQSAKIVQRYRDERKEQLQQKLRKFNVLWSNVQTLKPAVYSKMPKPVIERRYMDKDPAARLASTILERAVMFQMEVGYFHASTEKAVLDYLLPGMGQTWARYEPTFEAAEVAAENAQVERDERTAEQIEEDGDGTPYEKVAYERVCLDYVFYRDFLWGPTRGWCDVPWVARRSYLTKSEIKERFKKLTEQQLNSIVFDHVPSQQKNADDTDKEQGFFKKAEIWEIWNKADRLVTFFPPGTQGLILEEAKPEFELEGFWPCPEPLFTTQTNDTLVPVPDYIEYQDQAAELDTLTERISKITTAIRANGVYNAAYKDMVRLLQEGIDNKLIPVEEWAMFAEGGGMKGAFALVPMEEIANVLLRLYEARAQVKADLYEITGMSDIIRGQGDASETATAQRIKGQFASLRLQDRQDDVSRFCRDNLHIMAEIVAELFAPESLMQISGYDQTIQDEIRKAVASVPPPQPVPPPQLPAPSPAMAPPGGMPPGASPQGPGGPSMAPPPPTPEQQAMMAQMQQQAEQQAQMQFQQAQQQAAQQAEQMAMEKFNAALEILRSDKLRGFRIDIETDSTIQADAQADKEAATELFTATLQGLTAAGEITMQAPELAKPIGELLMFTYRKFRVGRTMEASLEEAIDKIEDRMKEQAGQPKPPSPEEVKAQAEQARTQADMAKVQAEGQMAQQTHELEMQRMQAEGQAAAARAQAELQLAQEKGALELDLQRQKNAMELERAAADLQIEREKFELEREKMELQQQTNALNAVVDIKQIGATVEANRQNADIAKDEAAARAKAAKTEGAKK